MWNRLLDQPRFGNGEDFVLSKTREGLRRHEREQPATIDGFPGAMAGQRASGRVVHHAFDIRIEIQDDRCKSHERSIAGRVRICGAGEGLVGVVS